LIRQLRSFGFIVISQSVFLKGVNDDTVLGDSVRCFEYHGYAGLHRLGGRLSGAADEQAPRSLRRRPLAALRPTSVCWRVRSRTVG
jgi:hypothetical protein